MKKIEEKNGLFAGEVTDKQAIRLLKDAVKSSKLAKYPNIPDYAVTVPHYEDSTANGLSKCIIDFLNSQDHCYCGRISNEGVMRTNQYGKSFRVKSSMQNGIFDLDAVIYGRAVKIEIKIGNDKMSQAQHDYKRQIENALGYCLIVKNLQEFMDWFFENMAKVKAKKGGQNA